MSAALAVLGIAGWVAVGIVVLALADRRWPQEELTTPPMPVLLVALWPAVVIVALYGLLWSKARGTDNDESVE